MNYRHDLLLKCYPKNLMWKLTHAYDAAKLHVVWSHAHKIHLSKCPFSLHAGAFYCHHLLDRGITVGEKFAESPAPGSAASQRSSLCEELVPLAFSHQGLGLLLLGTGTLPRPTTGTPSSQSRIQQAAEVMMKGLCLLAKNVL